MLTRLYSFKFIITIALVWLGALALGLALYSTHIYSKLAIENQTETLQSILKIKSNEVINDLYNQQKRFAYKLQHESTFQQALKSNDVDLMESWLNASYARLQASPKRMRLKSIIVRNLQGEVFAQSSDGELIAYSGCPIALESIGGDFIRPNKPIYALCSYNDDLFSEVLVPVGVFEPRAYLHVVGYAVDALSQIETDLNMPVLISTMSGKELYRSNDLVGADEDSFLYPVFKLYGDDLFLGANISAAFNQQAFLNRLSRTKSNFTLLVLLATISALTLIMLFLNRAFRPMNKMRNSVGALLTGKYASISEEKLPSELKDVVIAYNEMVEGLETETISRRQMEEKLRSEKEFISTTLDSITNAVVVIDSKDRIKLANPGAEKLFGDKEIDLIDLSIHEVLILYSNRETTRIVDVSQLLQNKQTLDSMYFFDPDKVIVELEFSASPMIDMEAEDVGYVIILKDVSEDRKLRRKLSYEGSHDQLTGFLNRVAFEQKFDNLITENNNSIPQHVLAYVDIDQFRVVNDTCGSAAGDLLLKQIASIIKSHVRKSDVMSRLGGDEFGVIMPFFEMERALQSIQKIIIEIQQAGFIWNDKEYQITSSIGVMAFGQLSDEYSEFYSKVTTACFLAKQNGGNQYNFIDENDKKVMAQQESMDWVAGILKGFSEDRFCLYVQPIVSLDEDEHRAHFEVLIRYNSPEGELIYPNDFLPPAERYNLIEKIDIWVVTRVIGWLQDNPERMDDVMFSINLSGRSIGSHSFHKFLHQFLAESYVDMASLCFEITETAVVNDVARSIEFINSIKALGAKFSLDDFGTGLSSFSYLKQFPVDFLKIDGEFVRNINEDDTSYVFVRSMTEVGHSLNIKVIAEFVESDTMFDRLREANVDYIQGYVVGKPVKMSTLLDKRVTAG
ncbi:MAG: diguanylate cyclase (GGDEF)-like protein/PAS domain S-box-containing protein [Planctomycetota bacterium]|jgi:diguanylate cyclase (GGDEF)-like protein/PAS domain S-box-containing protein